MGTKNFKLKNTYGTRPLAETRNIKDNNCVIVAANYSLDQCLIVVINCGNKLIMIAINTKKTIGLQSVTRMTSF